jgi:hypothetical protein
MKKLSPFLQGIIPGTAVATPASYSTKEKNTALKILID